MDNQIITGDCLEVLDSIEPGSARLIFADPPYNQGVKYHGCYDRLTPAAYLTKSVRWIEAATRLLSPDGSLWLLISHEWSARLQIALEDAGLHHRQTITWYETFGANCTRKFNRCSRPLLHMVRNRRRFVFNADAVRTPSARLATYHDKRANPLGKNFDDVWTIPRLAGRHRERIKGVPTQLPVELLRRVVGCASNPGDLVLDPFSGSSTTGEACVELGRRFIGIEQSPLYADLARQRLANITPRLAFTA